MKEFEDAMLDIAWENLKYEMERFKNINNKGLALITINGALASLLVGFSNANSKGYPLIYFLAMGCLVASIFGCICSIRSSEVKTLSSECLINDLHNLEQTRQIRGMAATIAAVETDFKRVNHRKSVELNYAIGALGVGATLLLIYSITLIV